MKTGTILRLLVAAAGATTILSLPACNTAKGVGQDVSSVGGHVEHAAENSGAKK
jgi:predicted small secreted protein